MQSTGGAEVNAPAKAPASAWYGLAVLISTTLFAFVDRQIINLLSPSFQKMLGINDLQLGILNGLGLALFASAAGYPIGWLADRFGRRIVFGGCIALWSVSTAACAFQHGFTGLLIATAGISIGEAALSPIIFSMIPDLFPGRQRNTANFVFFGAVLLGAAAGFGLGGAMLEWLASHQQALPGGLVGMDAWRVALILVAAPAPVFLVLLTTIRMTGVSGQVIKSDIGSVAKNNRDLLPFLRVHWRAFLCLYGAIVAYNVPLGASFTWLTIAMPRIFGIPSSRVGVQLGIALAGGTIAGLILPPLASRWRRRDGRLGPLHLCSAFTAFAIVPTLFMLVASAPWQIYTAAAAQMMFGLATAALMPGVLQEVAPPALRARLISILGVAQPIATGTSPLLVGAISEMLGGARGILTALVIVSLPCWLVAVTLLIAVRQPFLATVAAIDGSGADDDAPSLA